MADWYYIGHYGQIGPLTRETITDLVETGVITRESLVWQTGQADWRPAGNVPELANEFAVAPTTMPPPPPGSLTSLSSPPQAKQPYPSTFQSNYPVYGGVQSDKNRILAGVLQLIPVVGGIGRLYMGHTAIGIMQVLTSICGIGYVWSIIDGILILCGNVKYDGYGRVMRD